MNKDNQTIYGAGGSKNSLEHLTAVVERVTFHNPENGWAVLKVVPLDSKQSRETVVVHQTRVFAGATMSFEGAWVVHPKFGRQFKAVRAVEEKPASAAALEKYLGSGLIKGVGPKTAKKIVAHFRDQTLNIFEQEIQRLVEVPGIAQKKLSMISTAWTEHRALREVMMFLQSHGISTLFAVRIYKAYKDEAIFRVTQNPYCLADDFYGIGFLSADKVAISLGFAPDSPGRIRAGIRHVLATARNFGHCYLTLSQIRTQVNSLLGLDLKPALNGILDEMEADRQLMKRQIKDLQGDFLDCYYSKTLYYDEAYVAERISRPGQNPGIDALRVQRWISLFCKGNNMELSREQAMTVKGIVAQRFSILTGGPGCGKTTATRILVRLIEAMGKKAVLAAPTGRAAQRMGEVIGKPAKTIHRLLGWQGTRFKRNEENPLETDFLVVDECSMLDISLTASLLRAVPVDTQVVFIGDYDQLPSVGAGNVLKDLISSGKTACFYLTKIFRQAAQSLIIKYAHEINAGKIPWIPSPFKYPEIWNNQSDCLFLDSDEATGEQIRFAAKVKAALGKGRTEPGSLPDMKPGCEALDHDELKASYEFRINERGSPYETAISIPEKFSHVDLDRILAAETGVDELRAMVKRVHPWSSLNYGLSAVDVVKKLYLEWIPKYRGAGREIQILSPMTRGSLGTINLNQIIQAAANPPRRQKHELKAGPRIFRVGDRVIHRKNNYNLGVFNGDIGTISDIDLIHFTCTVRFLPDKRQVVYQQSDIMELDLAYAVTIHKSQGSEFEVVIIPVLSQHFKMLFRNLIYTGLTRAKKLAVFVGTRRALGMAVANKDIARRQTALKDLLKEKA